MHLFTCPICPSIHICPPIPSVHPCPSVHPSHLSTHSHLSTCSTCPPVHIHPPVPICLPVPSIHLFHPSIVPSFHLFTSASLFTFIHMFTSVPISSPLFQSLFYFHFYIQSILSCSIIPPEQPNVPQKQLEVTV